MEIKQEVFGKGETGETAYKYLVTGKNVRAEFCDTGASIMSFEIMDRNGKMTDVILGLGSQRDYMRNWPAFGAVIGRCANRIKGASFTLNHTKYKLKKNLKGACLHSGFGYHFRQWKGSHYIDAEDNAHIIFELYSEDGDQGFPGNLRVKAEYIVSEDRSFTIQYDYISDMDTVVNLTNHCYFNLDGYDSGTVLNHRLKINADKVTKTDRHLIPTGEIVKVEGTAYDFTKLSVIRDNMNKSFQPIANCKDYDINYVLSDCQGTYQQAAELEGVDSGIGMRVYTDMPGMQFYTAGAVKGIKGKNGVVYTDYPAVCFETQFYPDAVHVSHFPSPVIRAGEEKTTVTRFEFYCHGGKDGTEL